MIKNEAQLRKAIRKALRGEVNERKRIPRLADVLFEDADPTKVDADRFPMPLSKAAAKAGEEAELLATGGHDDGDADDDKVGAKAGDIPVSKLKPSQSSMDIEKAVAFAIAAIIKVKPFPTGPGGDLGAIITNDGHIMDGHHRWIASGMIDPEASVGGYIVDYPAKEMNAALNMITVKLGITSGKAGSGGFDQFNESGIKTVLEKFAKEGVWSTGGDAEKVVAACEEWTGEKGDEAIAKAAEKMGANVSQLTLSVPGGFPERPDMPVISKGKGHLEQAIKLLQSGQVDLNEPYAKEDPDQLDDDSTEKKEESYRSNDDVIIENWQRLAGLIK